MTKPCLSRDGFDHTLVGNDHSDYVQALGEWDESSDPLAWPRPNLRQLLEEVAELVPHAGNQFRTSLQDEDPSGIDDTTAWTFSIVLALLRYAIELEYNVEVAVERLRASTEEDDISHLELDLARSRWTRAEVIQRRQRVLGMELDLLMITYGLVQLDDLRRHTG